ncbi:MAG: hypothetical protein JSU87_06545 [Gemmatimonadota bacterium]|nr:MAG: hypothetical protein JSU87_06545 [Gemmatimonadota bacterium]
MGTSSPLSRVPRVALLILASLVAGDASAQEVQDLGDFVLQLTEARGPYEAEVREALDSGDLEAIVETINNEINLREEVLITFISAPAEQPPASYDLNHNQILITYRLAVELSDLFGGDYDKWFPSLAQIVLHEMGHALIDVNQIDPPPAGWSEYVADQLAFFIISEFYEAEEQLRWAAEHFFSRPDSRLNEETDHFPNAERAELLLCWINGKIEALEGETGPCAEAYWELVSDWEWRLGPSWKEPFGNEPGSD